MIFAFLNAAVFALLLQNLVFDGGFGMSEAIRIATKPKEFLPIAFTVAFFTGTTAAVCSALDLIPAVHGLTTAYHLLIYCAVLAAVYLGFTAVIRYGFEDMGLNRIEAQHETTNPASGAVMRHCHMLKEGTLRSRLFNKGHYVDVDLYAILRKDYYRLGLRKW